MHDDAEARAADWLAAWDAQGIHRTATAGDEAGADWLMGEAARLGAAPSREKFTLDRLDPVAAYLEIDADRIDGVPVFDAPATGAEGISGALGPIGGQNDIAVAELSPRAVYTPDYRILRQQNHRGLVIVCQGQHPGLGLLNAEQFRQPYGAPAIQIPSAAREAVLAAVTLGASARIVADSRRVSARACNVVLQINGRDRTRAPLVVMTPRSSWWQSTAERGGGLVCWLETLRALIAAAPVCDVIFTANSGHELGHLGLDDFIARRPGWDRPVNQGGSVWVHYGANIGAIGSELSVVSNDPDLARATADELTQAGKSLTHIAPPDFVPSGETRDIHRAGGRYATLVGTNPWFHLPDDRWPHTVDVTAVASIAAGAAAMVVALTR
ncbi:MAG TPA: hypothetical protein VGR45_10805 [Stellaceae bacterium]|nr:hypothetical protein [Stellaceae bacterium]